MLDVNGHPASCVGECVLAGARVRVCVRPGCAHRTGSPAERGRSGCRVHNGRTEGVNTKTKMIKRQMYGRAGFTLRHRILLS